MSWINLSGGGEPAFVPVSGSNLGKHPAIRTRIK